MKLKTMILCLGLFMSVAIIGYIYVALVRSLDAQQEKDSRILLVNSATVLQSALNSDLLAGDMVSVQRSIAGQVLLPNTKVALMLDSNDVVIASSRLDFVNTAMPMGMNGVSSEALLQVRKSLRGVVVESDDGQFLNAVYPIIMGRELEGFRPTHIGLLVISYDLAQSLKGLHGSVLNSTAQSAIFVFIILLVVGVTLNHHITKRIRKILEVTNDYIAGNQHARIALSGRNELVEIANAFDQVIDSVEQANADLQRSQKSLNNAQRIAHIGNWDWDIANGTLAWSDGIYRIFGLRPQQFGATYEAFLEYIHPDDREPVTAAVTACLEQRIPYSIEHRVVRPSGEVRIVNEQGEVARDDAGAPVYMSGTVQDITERKVTEAKVSRFGRILEDSWNEIYIFEAETYRFIQVNRGALANMGYSMEDMRKRTAYDIKPDFDRERFVEAMQPLVKGTQQFIDFETVHERKDGTRYPVEVRVQLLANEDPAIFFAVINDITERKIAEQSLMQAHESLERKVEERTRELAAEKTRAEGYLNIAGAIIVALDTDGSLLLVNKKGREVLGYETEDIIGKNWFETVIPKQQRADVRAVYAKILNGELPPVESYENLIVTHSGEQRLVAWNNTYIRDDDGMITGALSAGEDITERRHAEEALRDSERQLSKAQALAGLGNWSWRIADGEEVWSDEQFRIFGYEPGGVSPSYELFVEAIHPDDRDMVLAAVDAALHRAEPYNIDFRIMRPDGEERYINAQGEVEYAKDGNAESMVGTVLDITERKVIELKLMQTTKMATLGEMATGLAHELNQPLNVIRMAAHNIQRKADKGMADPAYLSGKLGKIEQQVERAAAIIDHMRIFGRRADINPEQLNPKKMVDSTLGLIGEQLRMSDIELHVEVPETNHTILGHQVQVEQVFLNLLGNARDQLRDRDGEKRIDIIVTNNNGKVQFIIEDNGGGIPADALPRIFEPFFSTKDVGAGTGLGLAISYGIIAEMSGVIEASNTDHGARFTITLPIYGEGTEAA